MKVVGVIGSTGSGKSTFCRLIAKKTMLPIFDADRVVHQIYDQDKGVIFAIGQIVPFCVVCNKINRNLLRAALFKDKSILKKVEEVVHSAVYEKLIKNLKLYNRQQRRLVLLDIPLLFKIKAHLLCDEIVVIKCRKILLLQRRTNLRAKDCILHEELKIKGKGKTYNIKTIKITSGIGRLEMYKNYLQSTSYHPS